MSALRHNPRTCTETEIEAGGVRRAAADRSGAPNRGPGLRAERQDGYLPYFCFNTWKYAHTLSADPLVSCFPTLN